MPKTMMACSVVGWLRISQMCFHRRSCCRTGSATTDTHATFVTTVLVPECATARYDLACAAPRSPVSASMEKWQTREEWRKSELRELLIGPPLNAKNRLGTLDQHMAQLPNLFGGYHPSKQKELQEIMQGVSSLPNDYRGVVCKRAMLLTAFQQEPKMQEYFLGQERGISLGMGPATLLLQTNPAFMAKHIAEFAQYPDWYTHATAIVMEMRRDWIDATHCARSDAPSGDRADAEGTVASTSRIDSDVNGSVNTRLNSGLIEQ